MKSQTTTQTKQASPLLQVHISAVCMCLLAAPTCSIAAGYSVFSQGAGSMAAGNAVIAHPEGLSSIYFNPALLLSFKGTTIEIGTTAIFPEKEVKSIISQTTYETENTTYFPSTLSASHRISDTSAIGLTINNSFGLGTDFGEDTVFRYTATESELRTWDINPSYAFAIHDTVTLAVGARIVTADVTLKQMIPFHDLGLTDGRQSFSADGTDYGWNVGLLYTPTQQYHFGLSYRSPVDIDISGHLSYDLPSSNSPFLVSLFPDTPAHSQVNLPGQLFLGFAWQPDPSWTIEVAARNEQYSSYDTQTVTTELPIMGATARSVKKNWDDVWAYMIGISYQATEKLRISGGYVWEENPVPDESFEPTTTGLNKHSFTLGLAQNFQDLTVRLSYSYDLYEDREIENTTSITNNGTYSQSNQSIALSLSYTY